MPPVDFPAKNNHQMQFNDVLLFVSRLPAGKITVILLSKLCSIGIKKGKIESWGSINQGPIMIHEELNSQKEKLFI